MRFDLNFASEQCQTIAANQTTATNVRLSASGDSARVIAGATISKPARRALKKEPRPIEGLG
ncbi:hypothetical protein [Bradyrhizobium sp. AUGA SZCCT0182]|uniref:hypothetical protein n=1 Tax=Bradyrhizobium sp. AUGA SZCCT0182 TaxID=2807667 RepID=UPI001BAD7F21|nr:hypothetical protein [Bradyrhizobium sp. AUGA SZCCT0182]MBR1231713.1 hypothetical protein [Bradyrhizobium sp. AUGA SZCCT0182]